jgi:hypothetical protein
VKPTLSDGEEPVDIATSRADIAVGTRSGPFEVKEGRDRAVKLCVTVVETFVLADLATQVDTRHLGALGLSFLEESHDDAPKKGTGM